MHELVKCLLLSSSGIAPTLPEWMSDLFATTIGSISLLTLFLLSTNFSLYKSLLITLLFYIILIAIGLIISYEKQFYMI